MTQINYVTLLTAILGACKLILQPMGIEIPDAQLNAIVNGAAAILTIVGIFMNHRKAVQPNVNIANQLQSNK